LCEGLFFFTNYLLALAFVFLSSSVVSFYFAGLDFFEKPFIVTGDSSLRSE
jgi:hypothetical protein